MSRTSRLDKFKSWYAKAKDSAVGKGYPKSSKIMLMCSRYLFRSARHGWVPSKHFNLCHHFDIYPSVALMRRWFTVRTSLTILQFLMRYYTPGDDIYFFGFSRGAYTARFLAEMLDHVGLLSVGTE
jgi:hypothetical protein